MNKLRASVYTILFYGPAAAACGALVDSAGLAISHGGGRVTGAALLWLADQILFLLGAPAPWPAVDGLLRYYPANSIHEFAPLALLAMLANAAAGLVVAAVTAPAALAIGRGLCGKRGGSRCRRFWRVEYPAAVSILLLVAGFVRLIGESAPLAAVASSGFGRAHLLGPGKLGAIPALMLGAGFWWILCRRVRSERAVRLAGRAIAVTAGLALAVSAVGVAAGGPGRPAAIQPSGHPNILLISIDSLRADHVHAYGYARDTTPTLDRLAREGVLFRQAVAPTTWTLPSHLTMLTALPPCAHQVVRDGQSLDPAAVTLAEALSGAGYGTAAFVSGPYLRAEYGFYQGFQHYDDYSVAAPDHRASHQMITSPALTRLVGGWLHKWNEAGAQRPFFIFLHMWDVHYDYIPPSPYDTLFDPDYQGGIDPTGYERSSAIHPGMDRRDLEHIIALYDGEIRYTDEHIGKILDLLREMGRLDETVVAVTADHGDEFFEHGQKGHRNNLYDTTLLVPLIIRYPPRIPAGAVVKEQVRLLDLAPTLLSLAGVEKPREFGFDISGGRLKPRNLMTLLGAGKPGGGGSLAFGDLHGQLACVRTGKWKLITRLDQAAPVELYHLEADPGEQSNLAGRRLPEAESLLGVLRLWRKAAAGRFRTRSLETDHRHLESLRDLGYIQ